VCALAQDSSRNRISRGAISSELTTWGKNGFSRSKVLQRVLEVHQSTPLWTVNPLEQPPGKIHHREELLRSSRNKLAQIPPREILLLEEIQG
jgi:hypothetical protein